jgi:hypothetical protein
LLTRTIWRLIIRGRDIGFQATYKVGLGPAVEIGLVIHGPNEAFLTLHSDVVLLPHRGHVGRLCVEGLGEGWAHCNRG